MIITILLLALGHIPFTPGMRRGPVNPDLHQTDRNLSFYTGTHNLFDDDARSLFGTPSSSGVSDGSQVLLWRVLYMFPACSCMIPTWWLHDPDMLIYVGA